MMAPLNNRPIIDWVLMRLQRCASLDRLVLATSDHERDSVLCDRAARLNVEVFAGDEGDVLGRFAKAADMVAADTVVRVCADNPFVAPEVIDLLVEFFASEAPDYAFNHIPRRPSYFADGFGAEIFGRPLLREMNRVATLPAEREHVTQYIWNHADAYRIAAPACPENWTSRGPSERFDVDTPDDLRRLQAPLADVTPESGVDEIVSAWRTRKEAS